MGGQLPWANCSLQGRQQTQTRKGRIILEAKGHLALCHDPMHSALMPMSMPSAFDRGSIMSVKLWIALINGDATAPGWTPASSSRPMEAPNLQRTSP